MTAEAQGAGVSPSKRTIAVWSLYFAGCFLVVAPAIGVMITQRPNQDAYFESSVTSAIRTFSVSLLLEGALIGISVLLACAIRWPFRGIRGLIPVIDNRPVAQDAQQAHATDVRGGTQPMPAEGRHTYTMFKRKYMVALAGLLAPLALILSAFTAYFHIMLPASSISLSEPGARAYYINEECILLVWHDNVFMIYPIRRSVVQPSDFRNSLLGMIVWPRDSPLVLWHRGAYAGVLLGDPVKGDELEKFDFVDDQVRIQARFHDPSTQPSEIVVKLPNAN